MKKLTLILAALLMAALCMKAQNNVATEIVENVVQQNQEAAEQAKQAYQDQHRSGNREISRQERRISTAKKDNERLKEDADQLKAEIRALDKTVHVQRMPTGS